jgi:hypothetical protein
LLLDDNVLTLGVVVLLELAPGVQFVGQNHF